MDDELKKVCRIIEFGDKKEKFTKKDCLILFQMYDSDTIQQKVFVILCAYHFQGIKAIHTY